VDILLHELTFTPLQVATAFAAWVRGARLSATQHSDVLRFVLLVVNVCAISACFDVSAVYHYIRGESFLKLYVIFNMLEMFERWVRSIGVDLYELIMSRVGAPWNRLAPAMVVTMLYNFLHSLMHLLRVVLLNVAINTSSSAVFLIIVTNNFGEIKSTVFKRYEEKSLFPIITSDIVERIYLMLDILFVLARLTITPSRGSFSFADGAFSLFLLVLMELGTDWIKFCLIMKFSNLKTATLGVYREVLVADILLSRASGSIEVIQRFSGNSTAPRPEVRLSGVQSFSHAPSRRLGFCGVPLSTLIVFHFAMLLWSPCAAHSSSPRSREATLLVGTLALGFLAKVFFSIVLFGYAARRRGRIARGLELFNKIKCL